LERHTLLHNPLHPEQTNPELLLDQFANCPNTPVAKMIDIVGT